MTPWSPANEPGEFQRLRLRLRRRLRLRLRLRPRFRLRRRLRLTMLFLILILIGLTWEPVLTPRQDVDRTAEADDPALETRRHTLRGCVRRLSEHSPQALVMRACCCPQRVDGRVLWPTSTGTTHGGCHVNRALLKSLGLSPQALNLHLELNHGPSWNRDGNLVPVQGAEHEAL